MNELAQRTSEIKERVCELRRKYQAPGLVFGLQQGGQAFGFASGLLNSETNVEARTDSPFQIGSVSKTYTATLLMILVDRGDVDLDASVLKYLPELELSGQPDLSGIRVRDLLIHRHGIESDTFFDVGRGDDALERLVAKLCDVELIHEPGAMWSYSNTGFILAGRIIEKITGTAFHVALEELLVKPMGLRSPVVLAEDALRLGASIGHVRSASTGDFEPVSPHGVPSSHAAAGSRPFATVMDLLAFAQMHIDGGIATNGARILSADTVSAMQARQTDQLTSIAGSQGIGWFRMVEEPSLVVGHLGDVLGYAALLLFAPDKNFSVACITNSVEAAGANIELGTWALAEFADIPLVLPGQALSRNPAKNLRVFEGVYRRLGVEIVVELEGSGLVARKYFRAPLEGRTRPAAHLMSITSKVFADQSGRGLTWEFQNFSSEGRPQYLNEGLRAHRRVNDGDVR